MSAFLVQILLALQLHIIFCSVNQNRGLQEKRFAEGTLVKCSKSVYIIEDGTKRLFPDYRTFASYRYDWNQVTRTTCDILDSYPTGPDMMLSWLAKRIDAVFEVQRKALDCNLIKLNNSYYYVLHGSKLEIQGDTLFDLQILPETAIEVSQELFDILHWGEPLNSDRIKRFSKEFHFVHNCHLDRMFYKPSSKVTVLLIMVDNRQIEKGPLEDAHYLTLATVLNREYAQRHGYDFLVFQLNTNNINEYTTRFYGAHPEYVKMADESDPRKNKQILFNSHVKQYRFAPWAKVPILSFLIKMMRARKLPMYDYICFIDSDAAFNPNFHHRSVSDFYHYWERIHVPRFFEPNLTEHRYYVSDKSKLIPVGGSISNASLILLSNFPCDGRNRPLPNTGVIFIKPDKGNVTDILSKWWDFKEDTNKIKIATNYEQDAFGDILMKYRHEIALIEGEHQFYLKNDYKPLILSCTHQWICHLMHKYTDSGRILFKDWLVQKLRMNQSSFNEAVDNINNENVITIPSFSLTQFVEYNVADSEIVNATLKIASKISTLSKKNMPGFEEVTEDKITYVDEISSTLHDYRFPERTLVKCSKSVYIIEDGTKRLFPDYRTFASYKYDWSQVTRTTCDILDSYPTGSDMMLSWLVEKPKITSQKQDHKNSIAVHDPPHKYSNTTTIHWGFANASWLCTVGLTENTCRDRDAEARDQTVNVPETDQLFPKFPDSSKLDLIGHWFPSFETDYKSGYCSRFAKDLRHFSRIVDFTCLSNHWNSFFHTIMDCFIPNIHLLETARSWESIPTAILIPMWDPGIYINNVKDNPPFKITLYSLVKYFFQNEKVTIFTYDPFDFPNCCCNRVSAGVVIAYSRSDVIPIDYFRQDIWDYTKNKSDLLKIPGLARSIESRIRFKSILMEIVDKKKDIFGGEHNRFEEKTFLFLNRTGHRKILNYAMVLSNLVPPHYRLVISDGNEEYSELLKKFYKADIVLGFHGAGFANTIFCHDKAVIVEISMTTSRHEYPLYNNNSNVWRTNRMVGIVHGSLHWIVYAMPTPDYLEALREEFMKKRLDKTHFAIDPLENLDSMHLSLVDVMNIREEIEKVLEFSNESSYSYIDVKSTSSEFHFTPRK